MKPKGMKLDTRQMTVTMSEEHFRRNVSLARKAGMTPAVHARSLIEGALAVVDAETNDDPDHSTIAASLLLHGSGIDREAIGRSLRIPPEVVGRIIERWNEATGTAQ